MDITSIFIQTRMEWGGKGKKFAIKTKFCMRLQVLMVASVKMKAFWAIAPYSLVGVD
jgi:hypothetical protein